MDINVALATARKLAAGLVNGDVPDPDGTEAAAMAEAFTIIDEWITGGGFLPNAWALTSPTSPR